MKVKQLYETFGKLIKSDMSIQKFCSYMRELGFEYKKIDGYHFYKITYEELKQLSDKKKWIHELDEEDEIDIKIEKDNAVYLKSEDHKKIVNGLQNQLDNMKEYFEYHEADIKLQNQYIDELETKYYDLEDENEMLKELVKNLQLKIVDVQFDNNKNPKRVSFKNDNTEYTVDFICNLFDN